MKKFLMVIVVIVLALPVGLYAQESDLAASVRDSIKATNAGDIDAAMNYFADEAVVKLAIPGAPETYTGAAQIRSWLEGLARLRWEGQVEILNVEGNMVTSRIKTWMDPTRAAGIAPLEGMEQYTFRDGKIVDYTWTPTEETVAKLQALMAPESMPQTGGVVWSPSLILIALGVLVSLGGLALARRPGRSGE